jgi:hypothetical protein
VASPWFFPAHLVLSFQPWSKLYMSSMEFHGLPIDPVSRTLNLDEFAQVWVQLSNSEVHENQNADRMAKLALAGIGPEDEEVTIDVEKDHNRLMLPLLETAEVSRDYDSLLGLSRTTPYSHPMEVYARSPSTLTLTADNHLKLLVVSHVYSLCMSTHAYSELQGGKHRRLCTIPNAALGKVDRCLVRMVFPKLYHKGCTPHISDNIWAQVYNHGIMPTLLDNTRHTPLIGNHHWPFTYSLVNRMLGDLSKYTTRQVPAKFVPWFGKEVRRRLIAHNSHIFGDCHYYHEIMGVKLATMHRPEDDDERERFLRDGILKTFDPQLEPRRSVISQNRPDLPEGEQWHVDVALEIKVPGYTTTWRTSGHVEVLHHLFPNSDKTRISDYISNHDVRVGSSSAYRRDYCSSLRQISGCLLDPSKSSIFRYNVNDVSLCSLYTTDKGIWYTRYGGSEIFAPPQPHELFRKSSRDNLTRKMALVMHHIMQAGGMQENREGEHTGTARSEIRANIFAASTVNIDMPQSLINRCCLCVRNGPWWCNATSCPMFTLCLTCLQVFQGCTNLWMHLLD